MIVSTHVVVVGRGRSSFSSEERAGRSGAGPGRVVRGRMGCDYYFLSRLPKSAPPRHLNFHVPLTYRTAKCIIILCPPFFHNIRKLNLNIYILFPYSIE